MRALMVHTVNVSDEVVTKVRRAIPEDVWDVWGGKGEDSQDIVTVDIADRHKLIRVILAAVVAATPPRPEPTASSVGDEAEPIEGDPR